jgi:hypothetical protein
LAAIDAQAIAVRARHSGSVLTHGLQLLSLDPLQERVHRALMRLYAAQGRHDAALAQYERCPPGAFEPAWGATGARKSSCSLTRFTTKRTRWSLATKSCTDGGRNCGSSIFRSSRRETSCSCARCSKDGGRPTFSGVTPSILLLAKKRIAFSFSLEASPLSSPPGFARPAAHETLLLCGGGVGTEERCSGAAQSLAPPPTGLVSY